MTIKPFLLTFLAGAALVAPLRAEISVAEFSQKTQEVETLCDQVTTLGIEALNAMAASGHKEDAIPFLLRCRELAEKACTIVDQLAASRFFDIDPQDASKAVSKSHQLLLDIKQAYADLGLQYESGTIVAAPTPAPVTEEASSTTLKTWTDVLGYSHLVGE